MSSIITSPPMAEVVSYCFSPSLLLAKIQNVLSDLDGRLSSSQVFGHIISWSRGRENTVKIISLQIPSCSFPVTGLPHFQQCPNLSIFLSPPPPPSYHDVSLYSSLYVCVLGLYRVVWRGGRYEGWRKGRPLAARREAGAATW